MQMLKLPRQPCSGAWRRTEQPTATATLCMYAMA